MSYIRNPGFPVLILLSWLSFLTTLILQAHELEGFNFFLVNLQKSLFEVVQFEHSFSVHVSVNNTNIQAYYSVTFILVY